MYFFQVIKQIITLCWTTDNIIGVEGSRRIFEVLKTNTRLADLRLMSQDGFFCGVGYEGLKLMSETLETNSTLTSLNLGGLWFLRTTKTLLNWNESYCLQAGNCAGELGTFAMITKALKTNTSLTSLFLSRGSKQEFCLNKRNECFYFASSNR